MRSNLTVHCLLISSEDGFIIYFAHIMDALNVSYNKCFDANIGIISVKNKTSRNYFLRGARKADVNANFKRSLELSRNYGKKL